jgi:pantetheine-phosphate adenylyltransferase
MSLTRGLYAGSFDPITLGHMDIIQRAADFFDELIVGVACNTQKDALFSVEQRVAMIQAACHDLSNVSVKVLDGLTVDFALQHQVTALVRGLRSAADFEAEYPMAQMNQTLSDGLETVFLATQPRYAGISSSLVKELIRMQANDRLCYFLSPSVVEYIARVSADKKNT